jgi:hypothetical protein
MKAYRVHGTTDDVTTCDLCGRVELKMTVIMIALDADGNDIEAEYFGVDCAAKAAGWTQRKVKTDAKAADTARREAEQADRMRRAEESFAREVENFRTWASGKIGVTVADLGGPYKTRDAIMDALRAMHGSRYSYMTALREMETDGAR